MTGPGTVPLKVQAWYATLGAMATITSLTVSVTLTVSPAGVAGAVASYVWCAGTLLGSTGYVAALPDAGICIGIAPFPALPADPALRLPDALPTRAMTSDRMTSATPTKPTSTESAG